MTPARMPISAPMALPTLISNSQILGMAHDLLIDGRNAQCTRTNVGKPRSSRSQPHAKRLGPRRLAGIAHIVAQVERWQGRSVFAWIRPGGHATQDFARSRGHTGSGLGRDAAAAA